MDPSGGIGILTADAPPRAVGAESMSLLSGFRAALVAPAALLGLGAAIACGPDVAPVLVKRAQARALAAELRADLLRSAEAEKRAVMADSDEASASAADEAEAATRALAERAAVLGGLLASLRYVPEEELLHTFEEQLAESEQVDATLLPLARANTNEKAWQLAVGPARESVDDLAARLREAAHKAPRDRVARAESLANSALLAVREIQVLEPPHIRASEDDEMAALEARMAAAAASARGSVAALRKLLGPASAAAIDPASEALERFLRTHADLVALSRQNTDVRSLALSLGEKRRLTAACDATLASLQDALAARGQEATR